MKKIFCVLVLTVFISLSLLAENNSKELLPFEDRFLKVIELLNSKPEFEKKKTKITEKLIKQGENLLKNNEIKKAKKCFDQAIKESEEVYGNYSGFTISTCQKIILSCLKNRQYDFAVEYTDKILGTEHELCFPLPVKTSLRVLNNAFMVYAIAGTNEKFNKCLKFAEEKIGKMSKEEKIQYLPLFYSKLARDYQVLNRYFEATEILKKALNLIPKTNYELQYNFLLSIAYSYLRSHHYLMSLKTIEEAIKLVNTSQLTNSNYKLRELQRLKYFSYFKQVETLCEKSEYDKAIAILDTAYSSLKNIKNQSIRKMLLTSIYNRKAEVYADKGELSESAVFYTKCFKVYGASFDMKYPSAARAYISLAINLKRHWGMRNNFLDPEKYLIKALQLAAANKDQGLLNKILVKAQEYYCSDPKFSEVLKNLKKMGLLIEKKKYNEAVRYIESILKNKKNIFNKIALTAAKIYQGIAFYELKKYAQALKIFKVLDADIAASPQSVPAIYRPNIFYFIARCEHHLKNYSKALLYYKKILKEYHKIYLQPYPDREAIYLAIGSCYSEIRNFNEASRYIKVNIKEATNELSRAKYLLFYGKILSKQKKYTEAIKCFDYSLKLALVQKTAPVMLLANAYREKANVLYLMGQKADALEALKGAMKYSFSNKFKNDIDLLMEKFKE